METVNGNRGTLEGEESIVLDRQLGTVSYRPDSGQYSIDFSVEGAIDSVKTGLMDPPDEQFRQPGLRVRVSGRLYKTPDLPAPMLGGQEMFRLEVFELSLAD